jgi:hypothetical protein
MEEDVIINKHPRYYNPTHTTEKCWTLIDFTPKYNENCNLVLKSFVCTTPLVKRYLLSKHRSLKRSGRYPGTHPRSETRSVPVTSLVLCKSTRESCRLLGKFSSGNRSIEPKWGTLVRRVLGKKHMSRMPLIFLLLPRPTHISPITMRWRN